MLNVEVNKLDIWNVEELLNEFYIEKTDVVETDVVLEINVGCRGEVEEIKTVEVVDGFFEVKTENEIREILLKDFDEEEFDIDLICEFVSSELFDLKNKKVWLESYFEESSSFFVRLK